MGGGFGGRDHTPFPMYVALAAMFCPGRPVRLTNNRFQQFQSGIKRLGLLVDHDRSHRRRIQRGVVHRGAVSVRGR
jgi:CO/xanthine dehydrogenase Mo-binding subunit